MMRYVIIGSGAAGFSAAEAIRSQDPHSEISMISDDPFGYYSRPGLAYYLTGEINESLLYPRESTYFNQIKVRRVQGRAARIDGHQKKVLLQDGRALPFNRCLVSVGAEAAPLRVPGAELNGVVKLDSLGDARGVLEVARKARSIFASRAAVVVGGGITALELVEGLAAQNLKVHFLLRGDRYWSGVLDEAESRLVEQRLIDHGVFIHYRTEIESILPRKNRVRAVRTKDGEVIPCEMLAYAIGIKPRLTLAQESGIEIDRGILVDQFLQTNIDSVFAAGDAAQVFDPATGLHNLDSLWNPARQQGHYAGLNMTGQRQAYWKEMPFNVTRLAGLTTTIIGKLGSGRGEPDDPDLVSIARGDSETWRALPDAIAAQTGFDVNHLRVLVGEKNLLGALVMGDQTLSQPLQGMILKKADITPIRQRLLKPGAPLSDILVEFFSQWSVNRVPV